MKRLSSTAVLAAVLLTGGAAYAGEQTVTLAVENMTCASCPYIVRKAMGSVPGVAKVDVLCREDSNRHLRRHDDHARRSG